MPHPITVEGPYRDRYRRAKASAAVVAWFLGCALAGALLGWLA